MSPLIKFELGYKDRPINSTENIELLAEAYDIKFSYDSITKKELITFPEHFKEKYSYFDPYFHLSNLCIRHEIPTRHLELHITFLCHKNRFNHVRDFLLSIKWDGRDRLEELYNSVELIDTVKGDFERIKKYYLKTYLKQFVLINCFNDKGVDRYDFALAKNILVLFREYDTDPCQDFLKRLLPEDLRKYYAAPYRGLDKVNASLVHVFDLAKRYKSIQGLIYNNRYNYHRNISYCYTTSNWSFLDSYKDYDYLFVLPVSEIHEIDIDMTQVYAQLKEEIEHQIKTGVAIGDILRMPKEYMEEHNTCLRYLRDYNSCHDLILDYIDLDAVNYESSEPLTVYEIYKELNKRIKINTADTDELLSNLGKTLQLFGFKHDSDYKFRVKFL